MGAKVAVDGTQWAVLRSIGYGSRHWTLPGKPLENLLAGEVAETGLTAFLQALDNIPLTELVIGLIPEDRPPQAWLVALVWRSRDHPLQLLLRNEC